MPRHEETTETQQAESPGGGHDESGGGMSYLRFGAMIATSMVFMYGVMYLNTFELAHVQWSETRLFMTLLMGSTMAIICSASCWACTGTGGSTWPSSRRVSSSLV